MIENLSLVNAIVCLGYRKTEQKFTVAFHGSKGYLSNIQISCEGYQSADNRIFVERLINKNGRLKSVMVNVFHSDENGVRLSTGNDEPKQLPRVTNDDWLKPENDHWDNYEPNLLPQNTQNHD